MARITLILGGVRSGKSNFALELAKKSGKKITFIATCALKDKEMKKRIRLHRALRPRSWNTLEEFYNLNESLDKIEEGSGAIIDCIGIYIGNLFHKKISDKKIIENIKEFVNRISRSDRHIFIVSNEVGSGVVPPSASGRQFRDILGIVNQLIAEKSDEVYLVTAGIPLQIKAKSNSERKI